MVCEDSEDPPQSQAQANAVVLEVAMINQHQARLKEEEEGEDGSVDMLCVYCGENSYEWLNCMFATILSSFYARKRNTHVSKTTSHSRISSDRHIVKLHVQ